MKTKLKKNKIIIICVVIVFILFTIAAAILKGYKYFMPPIPYIQKYVTLNSFFSHCDDYRNDIEDILKKYGYQISSYYKNNVEENIEKNIDGYDQNMAWLVIINKNNENDVIDITFNWNSTEENVSYTFIYSDNNANRLNMMKEILDKTFGYQFGEDELSDFISSSKEEKCLNWRRDYYIMKSDNELDISGKTVKGKLF